MSGLEGLGISANVIGVLVFGLQAAKFIAESVSKYQDAEDDHRRFLDAIHRLVRVLTDVNEILQSKEDRVRYSSLYNVAKKCEDELVQIHKSILEWTGSENRSKTVRTWKKFKLIFMGDNSKRWLESLESHYGFINFQLNRIQRDDLKEQKAATKRIETVVESVSEKVSIVSDIQVETLVRIDHVETNIIQQIQTNAEAVKNMDASVNINFDQVNGTLGSIDSLVKLFANTQLHKTFEERKRDEVAKAAGRIFHLGAAAVTRREAIVQQEQMEQVLGDIGKVIEFAKGGQYLELSPGRFAHDNPQQRGRKLLGLLASSDSLAIGYDPLALLASGKSKMYSTSVSQWDQEEFSLRVAERLEYDKMRDIGQVTPSGLSRRVTQISYFPKMNGYSSIIDVHLSQAEGPKPVIYAGLSFRTIIPSGSEILVAISTGSIDTVRYLVSTKQASVNDCDEWGQGLLTCCLMRGTPTRPAWFPSEGEQIELDRKKLEIAKYLIDQGSDLNQIDCCDYDPLSAARSWYNDEGAALLVDSGANPVVRAETILSYARNMDEVAWTRFLNQVSEFYDINDAILWTRYPCERPLPLLHYVIETYIMCEIWKVPYIYKSIPGGVLYHLPDYDIKQVVRKLISSGARVITENGENCLHIAIDMIGCAGSPPSESGLVMLKELLLFLAGEVGLDVRGTLSNGYTVTDIAIWRTFPTERCFWPIWVGVLRELGYNPLQVAEGSLYFDWLRVRLTSRPTNYCLCPSCHLLDEELYIENLKSDNETDSSIASEDECCALAVVQTVTPIRPLICSGFDFFERLSMREGDLDAPKSKPTVSDWLRIFEDWEDVEAD
ncbi:hypothetical protein TWF730_006404 [Orbilia blumenaviensis]|uniref:Azaphilone pigments biosynthesis cluster protein L N-terminal domain-containing protein n=1 Tax=Orbilia blumenaviensis TaxID=1796055 RepID=A0AAV9VE47_9PEZI